MSNVDWESAYEYFKSVHREVTEEELNDFAAQYRFSDEEKRDILEYYEDKEGDVGMILENIMLSQNSDKDRYLKIIQEAIKSKNVASYPLFKKTSKSIKALPNEEKEASEAKTELQQEKARKKKAKEDAGMNALVAAI
jgi:DnaJ family protein C protein 9